MHVRTCVCLGASATFINARTPSMFCSLRYTYVCAARMAEEGGRLLPARRFIGLHQWRCCTHMCPTSAGCSPPAAVVPVVLEFQLTEVLHTHSWKGVHAWWPLHNCWAILVVCVACLQVPLVCLFTPVMWRCCSHAAASAHSLRTLMNVHRSLPGQSTFPPVLRMLPALSTHNMHLLGSCSMPPSFVFNSCLPVHHCLCVSIMVMVWL